MRKHCGNCANHRKETNTFSEECGMCVQSVFENGEKTDPSHWREKPQTNADRIRAMSDEELAEFMCGTYDCVDSQCPGSAFCKYGEGKANGLKKWLKQPADMRGVEE